MRKFSVLTLFSVLFLLQGCNASPVGEISEYKSDGVLPSQARVFLLPSAGNGNLGGITGADALCQTAARNAGLVRTYRALVSSAGRSALSLIERSTTPIFLYSQKLGAQQVRAEWQLIWSTQTLETPIRTAADGSSVSGNFLVLGGTDPTTGLATGVTCSSWTDGATAAPLVPGDSKATDSKWINSISDSTNCNTSASLALYCIADVVKIE